MAGFVFASHPEIAVLLLSGLLVPLPSNPAASSNTVIAGVAPTRAREICCLVNLRFHKMRLHHAIMTFTSRLVEPLAREPIGLLTQSLLEKCHE